MAAEPSRLRDVAWREILPWLGLLPRAVRLAFSFRLLFLAAFAILLVSAGDYFFGYALSGDAGVKGWYNDHVWPWQWVRGLQLSSWPQSIGAIEPSASPLLLPWALIGRPFHTLFSLNPEQPISVAQFTYLVLSGLWTIAVWALFGGAITRMAAVELTRDDRLTIRGGLQFGFSRWTSYALAPLMPLAGVLMVVVPIMIVFGLPLRTNFGTLVVSVLWPLVLIGGLVMAVLLVGLFFGWPLMWATISVERDDWFGALSRAYSYVYQRPLHFLFYVLVAAVLGILGWALVSMFAVFILGFGDWAASWGSGAESMRDVLDTASPRATHSSVFAWGQSIILFWHDCVMLLAGAFLYSYFWAAMTAIYLLLRRQVDATDLDEIATADEPEHGLPPVGVDEAGLPVVAESTIAPGAASPAEPPLSGPERHGP